MADKGKFAHYMLKEIFEQPQGLRDTIAPRVSLKDGTVRLEDVRIGEDELKALRRINIVASGTSRHAGMAGQYMIQDLVNVPVDVDYASEFEYRNPLIGRGELTIVITQSGETADTTAAQREARAKGSRTIAISNVVDSTIAREADGVIYTHAGPEISIASTKAFTAQMAVLFLFALYLGQVRGKLSKDQVRRYISELLELPKKVETVLESAPDCERLADKYHKMESFLFLGRASHYPVAMDGPNALIDENLPVVIIATCDRNDPGSVLRYQKNVANIRGFKQQSGRVIAIASQDDEEMRKIADHTIFMPQASELLLPILEIVPLQLFAYYVAVRKGLDVDRPRNLVKSVTLE